VFYRHNQLRLKSRHKKRQELAVIKRATCNENIEFEKGSVLKKTKLLRKRKKSHYFLLNSQNVIDN
jgi:hypothetical protein